MVENQIGFVRAHHPAGGFGPWAVGDRPHEPGQVVADESVIEEMAGAFLGVDVFMHFRGGGHVGGDLFAQKGDPIRIENLAQADNAVAGVGLDLVFGDGADRVAVHAASSKIISDAFSPIIIQAALVLPDISVGIIEPSAMRSPAKPCTFKRGSTTAIGSMPILQVATG